MSEYFRVLKRIEKDSDPARRAPAVVAEYETQTALPLATTRPVIALPTAPCSAQAAAGFATLFENLRTRLKGQQLRSLVFAGVSAAQSVRVVTTGLARHVEQLGLSVYLAELTEETGRALLQPHTDEIRGGGGPLPLDLRGRTWSAEFSNWLQGTATTPDLTIIEGRPLAISIDAALLARACDGLVLVAQTEVTLRGALQAAAERARAVGCPPLGLVMHGTHEHLPKWLGQIVGTRSTLREGLED